MKLQRSYDFNKPEDAREFLKDLRFGDKHITQITISSGKQIDSENCSDKDASLMATLLYEEFICYQERLEHGLQS